MANEPFADFLTYLISSLKSKKTFVQDDNNIILGEKVNQTLLKDPFFPRLEILIKKMSSDGYIDQGNIEEGYRFTVVGHMRRDSDDTTDQDMYDIVNFARETKKIIYEINFDKRNGATICAGFTQMSGFGEIHMGYELYPRTSSFVLEGEAEILLVDTYTNN